MILVGEAHPDFPVESLIRSLESLRARARARLHAHRGFRRLHGRLRHRAEPALSDGRRELGQPAARARIGKAVLVSDVGSFREFPDDVCLKVPVGAGEEDVIFEYLNLLVSRPDVAPTLGARARLCGERMHLGPGGVAIRAFLGWR